ncbi:MAG: hypothetical protein AAGA80_21985 [Cyanobacteria bacterium P01_F01_bin.143]
MDLEEIASLMNNEDEQKTLEKRDIHLKNGNYNESIGGDYNDNRISINLDLTSSDPTIDNPNNLPFVASPHFVGREGDLANLQGLLEQNQTVAISAIAGMGGVGKTELVIQYAHKYQDEYPGSICWLRARKDIGLQIVNFAKSAFSLNIPDRDRISTTHSI